MQNGELSLSGGAIRGWDKRNFYYYQMLKSMAEHFEFDIDTPFDELPKKIQNLVLSGSGKKEIEFKYINDRGDITVRRHPFEGDPQ